MNKNTIGVLTGLAIVALGFVGYSTRGQWMSGTPQQVAEPKTAKLAEPEAPATPTQAASGEQPAAPAQATAAAEPSTAEAPAAPAMQAQPAAGQQTAQQPATEPAAAVAPAAPPPAEPPAAQPEQQTAAAEPAQPEQQTAAAEPAQPEQSAAPAEPAATEQQTAVAEPAQPEQPAAPAEPAATEQQTAVAEAARPATPAPATAAEPAAPSEQQAAAQPEAAPAQPEPQQATPDPVPSFDTVRVEKTGEAVIAGTAEAGAEIVVKLDGEAIGKTTANDDGAFVLVPEKPLPAGSGELTIESKGKGDLAATPSEQSVAVIVPAGAEDGALVAMMSPDAPTKVLQSPAAKDEPEAAAPHAAAEPEAAAAPAQPAAEAEPAEQPASQPETQVAAAPQPETQAQPEPAQPAPVSEAPAPAAPQRVSIDAVDYDSAGNIVFSGQGTPGLTARIYVDNKHVGDATIGADRRWSFSGTASVAPGVHSLRVDGLDGAGKVASRIEVPFFREDQTKVAAAQTEAPPVAAPGAPAAAETPPVEPPAAAAEAPASPAPAEPPAVVAAAPESGAPAEAPEVPPKQDQEVAAAAQPEQQAAAPAKPKEGRVVIQPGNNLWRISRVLYGSGTKYTMLYKANKDQIRNPNLIYPGQIFKTPDVAPMVETIDPKRRDPLKPEENAAAAP